MQRVARRERHVSQQDVLRLLSVLQCDPHDFVYDAQDCVEGRLDHVAAADRRVAMANLLEDKPCTRRSLALVGDDGFGIAPTTVGRVAANRSRGSGAMLDAPAGFAYLKRFLEGRASGAKAA